MSHTELFSASSIFLPSIYRHLHLIPQNSFSIYRRLSRTNNALARGPSAAQFQRQTQAVEFAQRNLLHHASGMQPPDRLMYSFKNCRSGIAHRNQPQSIPVPAAVSINPFCTLWPRLRHRQIQDRDYLSRPSTHANGDGLEEIRDLQEA